MDQLVSHDHARLIAQLESIGDVGDAEKAVLATLPLRIRHFPANRDIVRQGDKPNECCLILDGFVCRYKLVAHGRRQILSLHFAGDLPDLQSLQLTQMDHSLGALSAARVAFIPHEAMRAIIRQFPSVGDLLLRHALIDASIFREWIANVGRRTAYERIAHLLCEVQVRMKALQIADGDRFELPLTQTALGDATGLSTVHVNRTLQELRRDDVIQTEGKFYSVRNWERLQEIADFDISYLHMRAEAAP